MLRKIAEFIKIFLTEPIKWLLGIKSPTEEWARWLGIPECEARIGAIHKYCNPLQELEIARNHFENCDPEFITAAIFELNAAESRLNAARRCVVCDLGEIRYIPWTFAGGDSDHLRVAADNCVYAETDLVHFVPDSAVR